MSEAFINDDVTVQQYFEELLPQMFAEKFEVNPPVGLDGEEFRVNYHVGDLVYGIRITSGIVMVIVPEAIENAHLTNTLGEEDWRAAVTGRISIVNPVIDYNSKKHLDKIKNFKGAFKLRLSREGGNPFNSMTVFNGVDTPEVTIIAKAPDYAMINSGKLNPQMAMMTGKIKFEGSLPFLMTLGSLNQ